MALCAEIAEKIGTNASPEIGAAMKNRPAEPVTQTQTNEQRALFHTRGR